MHLPKKILKKTQIVKVKLRLNRLPEYSASVNSLMMVEVFKTNVFQEHEAQMLRAQLIGYFPGYRVSFDLEDCDKVLRVEGPFVDSCLIIELVSSNAYHCAVLE